MANYPGLHRPKNSSRWWVRKRTPMEIVAVVGKESIRRSLGTESKREAIRLYPIKMAEIELMFARARDELRSMPAKRAAIATGCIDALGRGELENLVRDWWNGRSAIRQPSPDDDTGIQGAIEAIEADQALGSQAREEGRDLATDMADRLLVEAGAASRPLKLGRIKTAVHYASVDHDGPAFRRLRSLVAEGLRHETMLARDHLTGEARTPAHPIFNPMGHAGEEHRGTVGDLLDDYRAERERLHGTESTARKYGLLFRLIEEEWGRELPTSQITRQRCAHLVAFIERLPANGTKKFPRLTFAQSIVAADDGDHKRLAPNTVRSYVQGLCTILRWGALHGYGVTVKTEGLKPKREAEVERRGMTPDELRTIFRHLAAFRIEAPHKFWIPALAAYTGARAGELCQLRTEDAVTVNGVRCLNLTRFDRTGRAVEGKRFKNRNSERILPIHDELLAAGFEDYVRSCGKTDRLFPGLTRSAKGSYSDNFSKWFGRFMDGVGLRDASLVFHSFRHGFRDACRMADIPDDTANALGGWAAINQGQRYGDRTAVPLLHRALQKVQYDDFSLISVLRKDST